MVAGASGQCPDQSRLSVRAVPDQGLVPESGGGAEPGGDFPLCGVLPAVVEDLLGDRAGHHGVAVRQVDTCP